ncbi:uncharacterized protein LOC134786487 [Penaeus indicus]|uniref:uncharacterized protein LOC134786487 n=1 Tax=Penaeus indicus TaxID=29960 RepID=UPI00300C1860
MRVSRKKTEYLCTGGGQKEGTIRIGDVQVNRVKDFKYLGSTVQEDGGTEQEIARRIQSGWNSWKKITGVVCDRKVPDKVKGKLHKLMIRPAMLYGLETVPLTKSQERELEVAEMRMMRYEVGVTRLDKIKNETTREILGIERYGEKIRESRLSWFGHVYRRDEEEPFGSYLSEMDPQGQHLYLQHLRRRETLFAQENRQRTMLVTFQVSSERSIVSDPRALDERSARSSASLPKFICSSETTSKYLLMETEA